MKMNQQQMEKIFDRYFSGDSRPILRTDGKVDVPGKVYMYRRPRKHVLPLQFNEVKGDFTVQSSGLDSLQGCPRVVLGDFNCAENPITDLQGAPQFVGGRFLCIETNITNLVGGPVEVHGEYVCRYNPHVTSLEGLPRLVKKSLDIPYSRDLPMLRTLLVQETTEISLWGSRERYPDIVKDILNKYKSKGWGAMVPCARELIRAGFRGNAKL